MLISFVIVSGLYAGTVSAMIAIQDRVRTLNYQSTFCRMCYRCFMLEKVESVDHVIS